MKQIILEEYELVKALLHAVSGNTSSKLNYRTWYNLRQEIFSNLGTKIYGNIKNENRQIKNGNK